jgi:phosphonopyruvate decarboxylase
MATASYYKPKNLIHILLDNEVHDSTGGQATVTRDISFAGIAKSFGYQNVYSLDHEDNFKNVLSNAVKEIGPNFIHAKIKAGSPKEIGRPKMAPRDVATRFMNALKK